VGYRGRRIGLLILCASLIFTLFTVRLVDIQILNRNQYIDGINGHIVRSSISGSRGAILDRDGSVLAFSDTLPTIGANPRSVIHLYDVASQIAPLIGESQATIIDRLRSDKAYVHLKRQVTPNIGDQIRQLGLVGIEIRDEPARRYPNGAAFARNVIGNVDVDQKPLSGLELQFASLLSGQAGSRTNFVSGTSSGSVRLPGADIAFEPAQPGQSLITTLHAPTQLLVESILQKAVTVSGANWGTAIVLDVATGEVLALADVGNSSTAEQARVTGSSGAYINSFEPGSATKPFTIAAALEEGRIAPDQIIKVPASYKYSDKVFKEPYVGEDRELSISEILAKSSNIGTIRIAEKLGKDHLYSYLRAFGFGEFTSGEAGVPAWPGETRGKLHPPTQWEGTGLANIAFGQGVSVTGIQLAAAFNTIANDGEYVAPSLILGKAGSDGVMRPFPSGVRRQVVSATTAKTMRDMLAGVVTQGTGTRAQVDGYSVAGKTGTAEKALKDRAGYSDDYTATFAGFVPAENPRLTIVVVLDEPDEHLAGLTAAPVFSDIATGALRALGVPQTK
jgi:cell division protein FtsI (penicillin-binding protein 3)